MSDEGDLTWSRQSRSSSPFSTGPNVDHTIGARQGKEVWRWGLSVTLLSEEFSRKRTDFAIAFYESVLQNSLRSRFARFPIRNDELLSSFSRNYTGPVFIAVFLYRALSHFDGFRVSSWPTSDPNDGLSRDLHVVQSPLRLLRLRLGRRHAQSHAQNRSRIRDPTVESIGRPRLAVEPGERQFAADERQRVRRPLRLHVDGRLSRLRRS